VRRGFKEASKRLALEVRAELSLGYWQPLDPRDLARLYGIPVFPHEELIANGCSAEAAAHFSHVRQATFSAALVPHGTTRLIIENSAHADSRRSVSIAHEMSHVLLEHDFSTALLTLEGCRAVDKEIEAEANQLGGELMIPYQAALRAARNGWDNEEVADYFGVSSAFARMRMDSSGARIVAARQRAAYQRKLARD
jgi:hypothetical protein